MYQQGDVLVAVCQIPKNARVIAKKPLAEGEVTGHAHRVVGEHELLELGDRLFVRILAGDCSVVHEEHGTIALPQGEYEVRRVREYDHFAEEARAVMD